MGKTKTRFLILGQGIAGTSIAYSLICRGLSQRTDFILVDAGLEYSSSLVSTGILNPVVFKRMTLSWGSELLPSAWKFYENLESFLNKSFLNKSSLRGSSLSGQSKHLQFVRKIELLHLFRNEQEQKSRDNANPTLGSYLSDYPISNNLASHQLPMDGKHGGIVVNNSGWIDAVPLLGAFRSYLASNNQLIEEALFSKNMDLDAGVWHSKNAEIHFDTIILCTGIQFRYSFDYSLPDQNLPFYPVKGDVLTLNLPKLHIPQAGQCAASPDLMVGNKVILQTVPGQKGLYRAGSSYVRDFSDTEPSQEGIQWLLSELRLGALGNIPELEKAVTRRQAGIRPASRDRLAYLGPLLGKNEAASPGSRRVVIFNGLGTKGFMIAPGLSEKLADWLLDRGTIPEVLSPTRVSSSYRYG